MNLYQRALGNPFVYEHIRPLAIGGLDMSPFYDRVMPDASSVILDVGCGTGNALRYLDTFARYVGVDTDEIAIGFARRKYGSKSGVSFACRRLLPTDATELSPTHVLIAGLLHHLTDQEALDVLRLVKASPRLTRIVTQDIAYLPGKWISNVLASLDRGRYCRTKEGYEDLVKRAGFAVGESVVVRSYPRTGLAYYVVMTLAPEG
jgi:SAM-dependent methyltransferase